MAYAEEKKIYYVLLFALSCDNTNIILILCFLIIIYFDLPVIKISIMFCTLRVC